MEAAIHRDMAAGGIRRARRDERLRRGNSSGIVGAERPPSAGRHFELWTRTQTLSNGQQRATRTLLKALCTPVMIGSWACSCGLHAIRFWRRSLRSKPGSRFGRISLGSKAVPLFSLGCIPSPREPLWIIFGRSNAVMNSNIWMNLRGLDLRGAEVSRIRR